MDRSFESLESEQYSEIPQKMNIFQRIVNLFFAPSKLFSYLGEKPSLLFPLIIISLGSILPQLLLWEQNRRYSIDLMYNTYKNMGLNYTPDQIETMINSRMILSVVGAPFSIAATWAVITLILYAVYRFVGCEKGLKKYFSMVAYISIISVLGTIVNALCIKYGGGTLEIQATSLSSLLDAGTLNPFLYGMASAVEVFSIWTLILYGLGFVYMGGVKKENAYKMTIFLFILLALLNGAGASISNALKFNLMGDLNTG